MIHNSSPSNKQCLQHHRWNVSINYQKTGNHVHYLKIDYWLITLILNNYCIVHWDNVFWIYQYSQLVLWGLLDSYQSMTWYYIQLLSELHWLSIQTYHDNNQSPVRSLLHDMLSRTFQWSFCITQSSKWYLSKYLSTLWSNSQ
jgi:hypothetical protein